MGTGGQAQLFAIDSDGESVVINGRCVVRLDGERRIVVVTGVPIAHFAVDDRMAEANAMVLLVEQGWASQKEVALAFGCSARTVRRDQRRYDEGGLVALGRAAGYPKGRPRAPALDRLVGKLKAEGKSNREIAHRCGVDEKAIRKRLRRLGWKPRVAEQLSLPGADPNVSAPAAPPVETIAPEVLPGADPNVSAFDDLPSTNDSDPADRRWDRLFACLGLLDDAAPLFRDGDAVPGAGVLLAIPSLVESDVLGAAKQVWGSIGPAFYGLRTTMMTMLFMALLRIQRPEALKERSPTDLGRILGLDRAPEVKTLRRKLTRLVRCGSVETFGRILAQRRVTLRGDALGFLYLDGHVRIYYGKRRIPKTHAARVHAITAATTDYWVNDQHGDPLLVITARANAGLVAVLPGLLDEIRALIGDRRVTVVFDRGGWSPELFAKMIAAGFDILTYRKGRSRPVPRRCFREHKGTVDGREITYVLADRKTRILDGTLRLRQVTRVQDRHQTAVLTSRFDLPAVEIAHRMFQRWRQENFFKYLREEFLLDALVDYRVEPDDPTREVPNPKWADADRKTREARAHVADLQRQLGRAQVLHVLDDKAPPTTNPIGHQLLAAIDRLRRLNEQRERIPRRVPIADTTQGEVIRLATERKHLTNLLKMVAYQAESDLVRTVAAHYKRTDDEGRTLIQTALSSAAQIAVTKTELRVTLAPLSSPHRSRAVAALCDQLNKKPTRFPGTRLRLRFAVGAPT